MGLADRLPPWLVEPLAETDPGFTRLLTAVRAVSSVLAVMGAETLLMKGTGALQISVGPGVSAAQAAAQHHQILVIAILLNGVIAMVSGLAINDPTMAQQALGIVLLPVFVLPALTVGLAIGGHRFWVLGSFPLVLAVGGYCRRFGARASTAGTLLFMGEFIGFLLHGSLSLGDIRWLAAQIGVATVVILALRITLFRPNLARTVRRLRRSYQARTARVAELALAYLNEPTPAAARRLSRQLGQLNEAALLIDGQLPPGARRLHQRLFDVELAVTNLARFTQFMADGDLPGPTRATIRRALLAVRDGDLKAVDEAADAVLAQLPDSTKRGFDRIVPRRLATALRVYAEAANDWRTLSWDVADDDRFISVVTINSGWLPGSAKVSAEAATAEDSRHAGRYQLPLYLRSAIQTAVAVGGAVVIGDAISPRRFYWAVLAAFLAFVGTNYVAEQVRKALHRVLGTIVGIVVGSGLVRVIGHHSLVGLAVALAAIFFGVYLFRVSYAFMVIGITVAISLVYVQLDEYSISLLLVRLAETAAGSAVALAVVAFVFPLRRSKVLQVALADELRAIGHLVGDALPRLIDPDALRPLRNDAREVDAAHQALLATVNPLRRTVLGDVNRRLVAMESAATAARNYSRNLVADVVAARPLEGQAADNLLLAVTALTNSIDTLVAGAAGDTTGTYVRAGSLFEQVKADLGHDDMADGRVLALRDMGMLDGALASLAPYLGVAVVGLDTGNETGPATSPGRRNAAGRSGS